MIFRSPRVRAVLGDFVIWLYRLLCRTLRTETIGYDRLLTDQAIVCGWHGRSLIFSGVAAHMGFGVIISQSRDGDIQAESFRRLGYKIIRGSTSRGGARAAVEAIRYLRQGGKLALTPDGPRGPRGRFQPGALVMAQKTGVPIIPCSCSSKWAITVKSWDCYQVPIPFSRCCSVAAEPIYIPADLTPEEFEEYRLRVEQAMQAVQDEADRRMGREIVPPAPIKPVS